MLRGVIPDWLSIIIGNSGVLLGLTLFYIALNRFISLPLNRLVLTFPISVTVLGLSYFTYGEENVTMRIVVVTITAILLIWAIVKTVLRSEFHYYRFSTDLASLTILLIGGILFLWRAFIAIYSPIDLINNNTPVQLISFFALYIGSYIGTAGFANMVSQRLQWDLTHLANTDMLTRIYNRRAAMTFLEKEVAKQKRYQGYIFSIFQVDVDDFKEVNDRLGHAAGDYILKEIANQLTMNTRTEDIVVRWG
jgi:GGDEF domain-containing protein